MNDRRTLLVRLSTIPLDARLKAARIAGKDEPSREGKEELLAAAISPRPEHDLHWVHASALEQLKRMREKEAA